MAPRLRGGVVIGRKRQNLPVVQYFCGCYECVNSWSIDIVKGVPIRGRYLAEPEYKRHRATEIRNGIASAQFALSATQVNNESSSNDTPYAPPQVVRSVDSIPTPLFPLDKSTMGHDPPQSRTSISHRSDSVNSGRAYSKLAELREYLSTHSTHDLQLRLLTKLVFLTPPTLDSPPMSESRYDCAVLDPAASANLSIITHQDWLGDALREVRSGFQSAETRTKLLATVLRKHILKEIDEVNMLKANEWEKQRKLASMVGPPIVDTSRYLSRSFFQSEPVTFLCYILVAVWHILCGVSMDRSQFSLGSLRILLALAMPKQDQETRRTIETIPRDIRHVLTTLNLEPTTTAYVCCPACCFTYIVDPKDPHNYPVHCTNQETPASEPCGKLLRKTAQNGEKSFNEAARVFHYQGINEWIGRLYGRPDIEKLLDQDRPKSSHPYMKDIWDAPALRELMGVDGKPFMEGPKDEGRLFFSLCEDGFNPLGNRISGKQVSTGGIYMVCLNLPPAIRFKVENVYLVGVIPGPHEPSLHQINHFLRPLVDDLLVLWNDGIYLTQTPHHPNGRLIRAALIPLVCDLPAARRLAGFGSHSNTHVCLQCKQLLNDLDNLDYQSWEARQLQDDDVSGCKGFKSAAEEWLNAESEPQREALFGMYGVRWSELIRLPYWDPIKYTVIDSMHAFFLGLFQRHCRKIWGMNIDFEDGDGISFDDKSDIPSEEEIEAGFSALKQGTESALRKLRKGVLRHLCRELDLPFGGTSKRLLKALVAYKKTHFCDDVEERPKDVPLERIPLTHATSKPATQGPQVPTQSKNRTSNPKSVDELYEKASKTTLSRTKKAVLAAICASRLACGKFSGKTKTHFETEFDTEELRGFIEAARKADGIVDAKGKVLPTTRSKPAGSPKGRARKKRVATRVLGKGTLEEIRKDMRRLRLPSWVTPAPNHPGEKKWGKFTADQWRAFCVINLPITLIRLWGSKHPKSREHRMLINFMHLVTAVKIATSRSIHLRQISNYEFHMHTYLTGLVELFPGTTISPYQHLSLHLGDFLRRFGPTHAWRCFPFERYNQVLQKTLTNKIFSELEKTMFERFCMAQNLRALFHTEQLPAVLHLLIEEYRRVFHSDIRGTFMVDDLGYGDLSQPHEGEKRSRTDLLSLPSLTYQLLCEWIYKHDLASRRAYIARMVFAQNQVVRLGQKFQVLAASFGDSNIFYMPKTEGDEIQQYDCGRGLKANWIAASVMEIFTHTRQVAERQTAQTFLVVRNYKPLAPSEQSRDIYRQFEVLGGCCVSARLEDAPTIISLEEVICHFAHSPSAVLGIEEGVVLAVPLDKE